MESISNLPTPANDLRSESKDYLRDQEHRAKWGTGAPARGCVHGNRYGFDLDVCEKCDARPPHRGARQYGRRVGNHVINEYKGVAKKKVFARKAVNNEIDAASDGPTASLSDTSGDESIKEASTAAVPDVDIMYSFDAQRGPTHGSDILGNAVAQAVQRYENKQTEKLVKEYDVIDDDFGDAGHEADVDEDGFEVIDYSSLR